MLYLTYRIPLVRERICRIRFFVLSKHGNLKVASKDNVLHAKYSSEHFGKYTSYKKRINFLIELVNKNFKFSRTAKVLSVGPRFESELFGLRGIGFKWNQIDAIDTYSYSPHITPGNMHKLPYGGSNFDLIVAGWVIAYSADPLKALREFHRVLKPGGTLILTWELPNEYEISSVKEVSLYRQKVLGNRNKLLPNLDIFKLKVETFKIQSIICSSLFTSPTPTMIAMVYRKGDM